MLKVISEMINQIRFSTLSYLFRISISLRDVINEIFKE